LLQVLLDLGRNLRVLGRNVRPALPFCDVEDNIPMHILESDDERLKAFPDNGYGVQAWFSCVRTLHIPKWQPAGVGFPVRSRARKKKSWKRVVFSFLLWVFVHFCLAAILVFYKVEIYVMFPWRKRVC
jgi:hypothetical protein